MTFTLVEVTEIGNAKVPFPLVQLVEVGANSIRRAVTTYVAVGSTIFLYPNDATLMPSRSGRPSISVWRRILRPN
jgi:hypothetical protein